jgi:hypothetical protein
MVSHVQERGMKPVETSTQQASSPFTIKKLARDKHSSFFAAASVTQKKSFRKLTQMVSHVQERGMKPL